MSNLVVIKHIYKMRPVGADIIKYSDGNLIVDYSTRIWYSPLCDKTRFISHTNFTLVNNLTYNSLCKVCTGLTSERGL